MSAPIPFTSTTSRADLDDLRARIRNTRWPDAPEDAGWSLGADVGYLRELAAYWADGYDWPAREARLNALPRYRVQVGGSGVHLVHARAATGSGFPLALLHGWPDSFWRFTKVIDLLTDPGAHGADPADAFDVVVPDMPGYGYSDVPPGPPVDSIEVARRWAELMTTLGYDRFGAAGGDIGSHVARWLALDRPERVVAVHRTDGGIPAPGQTDLSEAERAFLADAERWGAEEGAYGAVHRTKPQTAATALTDSPVGLLAWIVEKLRSWSDCDGDLANSYSRDEILDDVTIYWLTGTIGSSMRMYHANGRIPVAERQRRVEVPSGFLLFPADIVRPPREWLERGANVVRFGEAPRGGHFAAFEEPELYAAELREFFRPYRSAVAGTGATGTTAG